LIKLDVSFAMGAVVLGASVLSGCARDSTHLGTSTPPAASGQVPLGCSLPEGHYAHYQRALSGAESRDLAALETVYTDVFDVVSQHYAERASARVGACCSSLSRDPIASEFCSAAIALLDHENDAAKLAESMPRNDTRIEASNELDLILSSAHDRAPAPRSPDPFARYFERLWELAHEGNQRVIDNFMVMAEKSHGVHAEGAEIALCRVRQKLPGMFASGELPARHPALVAELERHCHR
jgi:hypothetical protein